MGKTKKELPDETVAARIIAEIRNEGLIPADRLAAIQKRLGSAGLDASEWMLLADQAGSDD